MLARPRIRAAASLSVVLGAFTVAGCGWDSQSSSRFGVRDSAGVIIVENTASTWSEDAGWHLSDSPALDIGVLEGASEYQLYRVRGAVRLDDGRIVVANAGSHELRFYSRDGEFIESAGRAGEGPGEFTSIGRLLRLGPDSLLVWSPGNPGRASIFDTAGDFDRTFALAPPRASGWLSYPIASFADGTLLANGFRILTCAGVQQGICRDSTLYLRYDRDGVLVDTIGRFPGREMFAARPQNMGVLPLPFARTPEIAAGGQGFYYASGDSYEIGYYGIDGALRRLVRKAQPNRPVTQADIDLYMEEQLESATDEGWRQRLGRMLAEIPYPETMPAISGLEVDAAGNLWVSEYRGPGDDEPRCSVFDGEGRLLGEVRMPPRFTVFEIGRDHVLGRWTGDLDVEHVQLYELIKG